MQQIVFNYRHPERYVLSHPQGVCAAIGVFDGLHLGHQRVLEQVLADAKKFGAVPAVITFDRHPISILNPIMTPKAIYPLETKLKLFKSYGIECVMLIPFREKISNLDAEDFFRVIATQLAPLKSISIGADFNFARHRSGNAQKIREIVSEHPEQYDTIVHEVAPVCDDQKKRISSTRIREEIRLGNLDIVEKMLGRPFSIISKIIEGDRIGRTLGFPTANLNIERRAIPPIGVYATKVVLDGKAYRGALDIGLRPTLGCCAPEMRCEVHILDFQGDVYDRDIEVFPVKRLRDETRFPSMEDLIRQIRADVAETRECVSL